MNKKATLAIVIALILPFIGYMAVSYVGQKNINMPNRYFYDSVTVNTSRGKTSFDTVWHRVHGVQLTNQLGKEVSLSDLHGKVVIMDFFFTHCPTICPLMTESMRKLQKAFEKSDSLIQFVSVSVDPEHDDISRLQWWASRFEVNPDNWWLTTGKKDEIYKFALDEMKASVADVGVDTGFIHTENFFLLDRRGIVRGWYNGLNEDDQKRLVEDAGMLMVEKLHKRTFKEFMNQLFS